MNVTSQSAARTFLLIAVVLSFTLTAGFADPSYKDALVKDIPHVRQKPDFCGEACTEMVLRKLGSKLGQDDVFNTSGVDPVEGRGCYTKDMVDALQKIGFRPGRVWYQVSVTNAVPELEALWKDAHHDLTRGIPSILCMHSSDNARATEHFRLLVGYDSKSDEIIYHEPAEDNGANRRMSRSLFLKLWPLRYDAKTWTVVRMPMEAGTIKETARPGGFTNADFAQHIMRLKKKLPEPKFSVAMSLQPLAPGPGWTILVQPPFVVIGDERPADVKQHAERTVKWAVDLLKKDFFTKDPNLVIDIWLFKDKASYRENTEVIFGERPTTPFGYYSSQHSALIMNIGTGGGTLVHEIVHPFVRANFPACPAWLNEGLGSLYEQCGEKDGHICGYTNWRLEGLQEAISAGTVPSFEKLTSTTDLQFYNEDRGTNYAQARYLCYYLQEQGKLFAFYRLFHANQKDDPTGYQSLKKTLGESDMVAFKKKWEAFVMKLKFP